MQIYANKQLIISIWIYVAHKQGSFNLTENFLQKLLSSVKLPPSLGWHKVESTEILHISHFFDKNFVKATDLLNMSIKNWFHKKFFRWERFSHFYTLWVEMKRKTLSQFLRRNNFSIKSSYTSPYWHITNLRPLWDWILIGILCVLLYNLKWIDLIRKKLLGTNNFKCSINPQLFAFKLSLGIVIQIGRINQEMYYKTGSSWKI